MAGSEKVWQAGAGTIERRLRELQGVVALSTLDPMKSGNTYESESEGWRRLRPSLL